MGKDTVINIATKSEYAVDSLPVINERHVIKKIHTTHYTCFLSLKLGIKRVDMATHKIHTATYIHT